MQTFHFGRAVRLPAAVLCIGALLSSFSVQAFSAVRSMAAVDLELLATPPVADTGALAHTLDEAEALLAESDTYIPHVWPVEFSEVGYISSCYGPRLDPVTGESIRFHAGVDLADRSGSKIYAAAAGTVAKLENDWDGLGLNLVIDHGNGYTTRYSHLSGALAEEGDLVEQGQLIALMGSSGYSTGSHLDFRVYLDGLPIDPMGVLDRK